MAVEKWDLIGRWGQPRKMSLDHFLCPFIGQKGTIHRKVLSEIFRFVFPKVSLDTLKVGLKGMSQGSIPSIRVNDKEGVNWRCSPGSWTEGEAAACLWLMVGVGRRHRSGQVQPVSVSAPNLLWEGLQAALVLAQLVPLLLQGGRWWRNPQKCLQTLYPPSGTRADVFTGNCWADSNHTRKHLFEILNMGTVLLYYERLAKYKRT